MKVLNSVQVADQMRQIKIAMENTLRPYETAEEKREAARRLGIEHMLPDDDQQLLPLSKVA